MEDKDLIYLRPQRPLQTKHRATQGKKSSDLELENDIHYMPEVTTGLT